MIELTWVPEAIRAFFWLYVLAALIALILAAIKPKTILRRVIWSVAVALTFVGLPYLKLRKNETETVRKESNEVNKAKLAIAEEAFKEHCKSAGEKINRTVEDVEGVFWMKWRDVGFNQSSQFKLDDPFGHDCGGEECITSLLKVSKGRYLNPKEADKHSNGYKYVDMKDPRDGQLYRYTGSMIPWSTWTQEELEVYYGKLGKPIPADAYRFGFEREVIKTSTAKYGVTWDDISTKEDRENWIAGGSLKVIDLKNSEVIGERVGYMMDPGQGSSAGFRSPWLVAHSFACPVKVDEKGQKTMVGFTGRFVKKILIPFEGK